MSDLPGNIGATRQVQIPDMPPRIRAIQTSYHFDCESGRTVVRIESLPWPKVALFGTALVNIAIDTPSEHLRHEEDDEGYLVLCLAGVNASAKYRLLYDIAYDLYRGKLISGDAEMER